MKALKIIIVGVLIPILGFSQVKVTGESREKPDELKGTVKVMAAPELFEISSMWAEEFDVLHDKLKVKVTERIRPDCVYMVHGFGQKSKKLRRAYNKGADDQELITKVKVDPVMGGQAMHHNYVTFQV